MMPSHFRPIFFPMSSECAVNLQECSSQEGCNFYFKEDFSLGGWFLWPQLVLFLICLCYLSFGRRSTKFKIWTTLSKTICLKSLKLPTLFRADSVLLWVCSGFTEALISRAEFSGNIPYTPLLPTHLVKLHFSEIQYKTLPNRSNSWEI